MHWTVSEGVNYECACEAINHVIAIYSTAIDDEERTPAPNQARIAAYRAEALRLAAERDELSVTDQDGVRQATERYSKIIREHFGIVLPSYAA